jgi:hypothetical protein
MDDFEARRLILTALRGLAEFERESSPIKGLRGIIGIGRIRHWFWFSALNDWTKNTKHEHKPPSIDSLDGREFTIVEHPVGQLIAKVWATIVR